MVKGLRFIFVITIVSFVAAISVDADRLEITLGEAMRMPNVRGGGVPNYTWFPDGHITLLPDGDQFHMYWAGSSSYRTLGPSMTDMKPPGPAVITKGPVGSYDNGGAWLFSVFRNEQNRLIGFYHAEDHEFEGDPESSFTAWKSIASCISEDNGVNWKKQGQIITSSRLKPKIPTWGGNGDYCVIFEPQTQRYICYYQEHYLCMAVSTHPEGAPGTWLKYFNGSFSEPGLGGRNDPVPELKSRSGGNPSVHFNHYLEQWVMVWHSWDDSQEGGASLWYSTSENAIQWDTPRILLPASGIEKLWYPTIIGETDQTAGQDAWLYYAYWRDKDYWQSTFTRRSIHFDIIKKSSIKVKPY